VGPLPLPPTTPSTVASRPKILQNNSKPAEKRRGLAGKICGHMAAVFGQKRPNNFWNEKHVFMHEIFHFLSYSIGQKTCAAAKKRSDT
jgi:hypothetical protein